jgi:hypothetical protein
MITVRTAIKAFLVVLSVFGTQYSLEAQSGKQTKTESPVIIYYGLNESHSRSWAQINEDGIVGIAYFQRFEDSENEGTLIYKTIHPDGSENTDSVTIGTRLEKSVLLYDSLSSPHIFVAKSDDFDQVIDHYQKNGNGQWQSETVIHFYNEGGKFIYELSADTGPGHSFHLLLLKTRSDVDSDDFWDAWINSYLYHLTNATGVWEKELIHNYDTAWTEDMYIKSSSRQDIKVDDDGHVHVTFSEQINATETPSRLRYASNKTGAWELEIALNYDYGPSDDAGWFPSLDIDTSGTPYISCMYVNRVPTLSAMYCKLFLLKRLGDNDWQYEIIADRDDGYYGGDGRKYTGALSHLVFDEANTPHLVFSDIASTHWPGSQLLNVGNIRYGVLEDGVWNFTTIYRQPLPTGFLSATEMHGMCLTISEETGTIRVIGQELEITGAYQYTCSLLEFAWDNVAPETPQELAGVTIAGGLELTWTPNAEGDLSHYALYRGNSEDFIPGSGNLISETPDTSVIDSTWAQVGDYYYKLSAGDIYGNESDYALLRPSEIIVPTRLQSFNSVIRERAIEISWRLSEAGVLDFDILRTEDQDSKFRKLPSPDISRENLSYTFVDDSCEPGRNYRYRVIVFEDNEQRTLFETSALLIPVQSFTLRQNYPNPFNPTTTISFTLPEKSHVNFSIYDLEGKLVRTLINGEVDEGSKQITWDGTGSHGNRVSSGVYYYRLKAGKKVLTRKMVLLK